MIVQNSYQNHTKIISNPCQKSSQNYETSPQNNANIIPKSCQNHTRILPESCQSHAKIIFKSCQNHARIMSRPRRRINPKVFQNSFKIAAKSHSPKTCNCLSTFGQFGCFLLCVRFLRNAQNLPITVVSLHYKHFGDGQLPMHRTKKKTSNKLTKTTCDFRAS